jgi:hypothetical protein
MKAQRMYQVLVLGGCAALLAVVGLRSRPTLGISRQAALPARSESPRLSGEQRTPAAKQRVLRRYASMPLRFEARPQQPQDPVKFVARGDGYELFLSAGEAIWRFDRPSGFSRATSPVGLYSGADLRRASFGADDPSRLSAVVRMKLLGANPAASILARDELPGRVNYYLGNDPKKWRTNVRSYGKVYYRGVYPGVDLVFYGNRRQPEYDFVVAPGADPGLIKLHYEGAERQEVDDGGNLVLHLAGREVVWHAPGIYQEIGGARHPVRGGYVAAGGEVGFQVAAYDATRPLIIDPVIAYSTFLGGTREDQGFRIAVDSQGNAYIVGQNTSSYDFPTENAFQPQLGGNPDLFVTKFNAGGEALIYSTYLGGRGEDIGQDITVDGDGNAYVTGWTLSTDFPTVKPFQPELRGSVDGFVTKFDPVGGVVYSTYLGGSGFDTARGIAVDAEGNVYVTGSTSSSDFPTVNPFQESLRGQSNVWVAKFDPSGSALVYSTYLGGSGSSFGIAIAIDSEGSACVTGLTNSSNFPMANAFQPVYGGGDHDGFVTKFDPTGAALVFSTYLGGSAHDGGWRIAVDPEGNAYVTGNTSSRDFPTVNPFQPSLRGGPDAYVTKFDPTGDVVYSTYLGGSGATLGQAIAVDAKGQAYVTGSVSFAGSRDFPTVNPVQAESAGAIDVFITQFDPTGAALVFSTFLGGSSDDRALGIAVDAEGNIYVTGETSSTDFPTENPFQPDLRGIDAFVTKISPLDTALGKGRQW